LRSLATGRRAGLARIAAAAAGALGAWPDARWARLVAAGAGIALHVGVARARATPTVLLPYCATYEQAPNVASSAGESRPPRLRSANVCRPVRVAPSAKGVLGCTAEL